jgi:A/G-specific adenine glycosylase
MSKQVCIRELEQKLLDWYDKHRRVLPWRAKQGMLPNPYHVWLSEIMLQQTTVATVQDYFKNFLSAWPRIDDLAKASLDEIFHKWQGLGYYARARNLHKCAQTLVKNFDGKLPCSESVLLSLPGIGSYTAAAIAAIAYNEPIIPVDGNVIRVFSRIYAVQTPLPVLKHEIQVLAKTLVPSHRHGDFAQALMDLGSMVCRPRNPQCTVCPLQKVCQGYQAGIVKLLPRAGIKKAKPTRYGVVFWIENSQGQILLEKRPEKGLLGGLMGLPTTLWQEILEPFETEITKTPCLAENWECIPIQVHHTFTHFHLVLQIARGKTLTPCKGIWCAPCKLGHYAFPTLMKKVISKVIVPGQKLLVQNNLNFG